jgi:hypothetical protein
MKKEEKNKAFLTLWYNKSFDKSTNCPGQITIHNVNFNTFPLHLFHAAESELNLKSPYFCT